MKICYLIFFQSGFYNLKFLLYIWEVFFSSGYISKLMYV